MSHKPQKRYWDLEAGNGEQGGRSGELYLYGTIVEDKWSDTDVTPVELINSLQALGEVDELNVHIFSNGGDVFAGNAIFSLLKQRKEPVNIYIEGIAASIASVIAMAGDRVYVAKNAMFMVHRPMMWLLGLFNQHDMTKYIAELARVSEVLITAYVDKTGKSADEIYALLDANGGDGTYLNADEAIQMGFADAITPDAKAPKDMAAMVRPRVYTCRGREIDLSVYPNLPELPFSKVRAEKRGSKEMAKAVKKIKAELVALECPHCSAKLDYDIESGEVSVAAGVEAKGGKQFKAELVTITCPSCGEEFDYDTETGTDTTDEPISTQAKRVAKAKKANRAKATVNKGLRRIRAEDVDPEPTEPVEILVTCDECGAEFTIDADPAADEIIVPCPECGAELTVSVNYPPVVAQDDNEDDEDNPAISAVRKERKRVLALDNVAKAFPQFSKAVEDFKRSGTSVAAAQQWVFQALAARQTQGGSYRDAARRDAQVLNKVASPASGNSRNNVVAANFDSLAKRRGVKKNG